MKNIEKMNNLTGFTLAEVLITLGIIGVIAGMTIPVLMTQIQDKQFKEAAKAAYSKTAQAIQLMKTDEGGSLSAYYPSNNTFKPVFMKYFKVVQDCNWQSCVPGNTIESPSQVYKTLTNSPTAENWLFSNGQFITNDGMLFMIHNNSTPLSIIVDVNGYQKPPNQLGRDVFMFEVVNDNLLPEGARGTWVYVVSSGSYNLCDRTSTDSHNGLGCMNYVMQGTNY